MTQEQKEAVEEVQRDIEKAANGSYEDRQEVMEKYENRAREQLEKNGYNYDEMKAKAMEQYDSARAQYGF